ncbi:UNVERIFIED_CONTAM: hypothetical protein PYX00_010976 [Menopon gallinae]|uniref:DUS-like FMN-binding domain-containing protein n=1 Tax=Menopon gallinae TaxID=328185 RepID=A0AAW2H764_9NEOP
MVDRTDRHFRYLIRLLSKNVLLYSEMHTTPAILKGKTERILKQTDKEENCVLQIASDSAQESYEAIKKAERYFNYSQYNLNQEKEEVNAHVIYPHLMGLLHEQQGAKNFRKILSPPYYKEEKVNDRFDKLFKELPKETLDRKGEQEIEDWLS